MFSKILRSIGIWGYVTFGVLAMLFVAGEIMDDPGGTQAAAFIAAIVVPLIIVIVLILKRVSFLKNLMLIASGVVIVASVATSTFSAEWLKFKFTNGPVLGIASMVLTFGLALWARDETRLAGVMMLLVTAIPLVGETIAVGRVAWGGSSFALMFPGMLCGALILVSTYMHKPR